MTHAEATKILNGRDSKKVANNTHLIRLDAETIGVRLHNTIVVEIRRDGTYRLNSGRWQTVTTKDRLNRFSPARVFSYRNSWKVEGTQLGRDFFDGIIVDGQGNPLVSWKPTVRQEWTFEAMEVQQ